jgi:hypothetical protein
MNEIQFLHKNMKMWEEFDQLLDKSYQAEPDTLYELYIKLTDDLAYARTYFPESEAVHFLNQLTQKAHGVIYQSQPTDKTRLFRFWKQVFHYLFTRRGVRFLFPFLFF